jgi:hypothetical protein
MEAATLAPQQKQVKKYLVKNNTAGYVGVVKINPRTGEEEGENIDPFGTIWLTHDEIIATARAPRRKEDNPFEEQTLVGVDTETQRRVEYKVRPLTLVEDTRFLPENDRFIPTQVAPEGSSPAAAQEAAKAVAPTPAPSSAQAATVAPDAAPLPPPPTPVAPPVGPVSSGSSAGLAGIAAEPDGEARESWVQPPEAPGQILDGSLRGSDEVADAASAPEPTNHPVTETGERFVPSIHSAQSAPQTVGSAEEEHAAAVDPAIGEETGAAKPPSQPAPEGEYAAAEEVGSPDAPRSTRAEE